MKIYDTFFLTDFKEHEKISNTANSDITIVYDLISKTKRIYLIFVTTFLIC